MLYNSNAVLFTLLVKPGDIIRLFFTAMGGGFCIGELMFISTWIYFKIKKSNNPEETSLLPNIAH